MKKIISIFIASMLLITCTCVLAEDSASFLEERTPMEIYINGENIGSTPLFADIYSIPLSKAMTVLGYEVSYDAETCTVCASNDKIAFYFNIPQALVWSVANGEKADLCLERNPVVLDGTTYVSDDFFSQTLNLYKTIDYKSGSVYFYDLEAPAARLRDTYKSALAEYAENGYDINAPQEYTLSIDFTTDVACSPLGISVTGGGDFSMSAYCDLKNSVMSYSYDGNVSGIYNIYKLINGKPLDEAKRISGSMYMDKDAMYSKSNLTDGMYEGKGDGKWIETKLVGNMNDLYNFESTYMYKEMLLSLVSSANISGAELIPFCNGVTKGFEKLLDCVSFSIEDGKTVITSKITATDIKQIVMDVYSNAAVGSYYDTRESKIENQLIFFNKLFETAQINVDEKTIVSAGKIESQTSEFDVDFTYPIPDVNVPISFKISGRSKVDGTKKTELLKQPPALEDIFDSDAYWENKYSNF